MRTPDGRYVNAVGEILEYDPPNRLRQTVRFVSYDDPAVTATYELADAPQGGVDFTVTLEDVPTGTKTGDSWKGSGGAEFVAKTVKQIVEDGRASPCQPCDVPLLRPDRPSRQSQTNQGRALASRRLEPRDATRVRGRVRVRLGRPRCTSARSSGLFQPTLPRTFGSSSTSVMPRAARRAISPLSYGAISFELARGLRAAPDGCRLARRVNAERGQTEPGTRGSPRRGRSRSDAARSARVVGGPPTRAAPPSPSAPDPPTADR